MAKMTSDHGEGVRRCPAIPVARELEVVERLARSEHPAAVAGDLGCSERSVRRFGDRRHEEIRSRQEQIQLETLEKLRVDGVQIREAMVASALDPANRNQTQAYRGLHEVAGMIGKGGGIHIGDVNNTLNATQVNVDPELMAQAAREFDPERLAELQKQLGLS